jgi:hypothetical protein
MTLGHSAKGVPRSSLIGSDLQVRQLHKADMLNALTNVRFWGQNGHFETWVLNKVSNFEEVRLAGQRVLFFTVTRSIENQDRDPACS